MNDLYAYPINDYRSYLQHHGTKGQKWGVRNAEWYPISEWKASKTNKVAEKKERRAAKAERKYEAAKQKSERHANSVNKNPSRRLSAMEQRAKKRRDEANKAREYADEQRVKLLKKALQDPNLLRKHVNEIPAKDVEDALNRFSRERRVEQAARDKNTVFRKDIEQYVLGPGKMVVAGYGTYKGLNALYGALKSIKK